MTKRNPDSKYYNKHIDITPAERARLNNWNKLRLVGMLEAIEAIHDDVHVLRKTTYAGDIRCDNPALYEEFNSMDPLSDRLTHVYRAVKEIIRLHDNRIIRDRKPKNQKAG